MVVWKCRVGPGEKLDQLNAKLAIDRNRRYAAHAVAGVDDGLDLAAAERNSQDDIATVIVENVNCLDRARTSDKPAGESYLLYFLNLRPEKSIFLQAYFESVMVRRVV